MAGPPETGTYDLLFVNDLTPTQEHFLKKFLVEEQLKDELHFLSQPKCLEYLGAPFHSSEGRDKVQLPLLRYFFSNFVATFPLITNNLDEDQVSFWRDTVQPFVESFNEKHISDAVERKDLVTKRHQVNVRLLGALLLFYNSMISLKRELQYLREDHLKPSDKGKLDKLSKGPAKVKVALDSFQHDGTDLAGMVYVNDYNLNIVAVDVVQQAQQRLWYNPLGGGVTLHFKFVMQVTRRTKDGDAYKYATHYISRSYLEFKDLERALSKKYPGLMTTEVTRIPHKMKNDDGMPSGTSEATSEKTAALNATSTDSDAQDEKAPGDEGRRRYYREKLRLALRGYLSSLVAKPEIAHCLVLERFVDDGQRNFHALSPAQEIDRQQREELERHRVDTQQEFQHKVAGVVHALTQDFERFKAQLVEHPHQLSDIFAELGSTKLVAELSPLLRTFFEWCKLEVAATLYQVFLTQDNLADWLRKCRKFHRMFPYNVCYGILKYTNPVRVMSRLVDLLLADIPFKNTSLLLMTFVMLLDEDLNDYSTERAKHLDEPPLSDPAYAVFVDRIGAYVAADSAVRESLRNDAAVHGTDLLLGILRLDALAPPLGPEHAEALARVEASHRAYATLAHHRQVHSTELYVALRQLWQLEMHARDKELLKQLWREPELTRLLKRVLTLFYQPLMSVMKKCGIHEVFRDWQHFVDDLMAELTRLDEGAMYYTSSVEMFDRFKLLLDKHENSLWRFMHNLYTKDDQQLFMKLVRWLELFLVALRAKYAVPSPVELDVAGLRPDLPVNARALVAELDGRIGAILSKRRLIRDYLQRAGAPQAAAAQNKVDDEWERLNLFALDPLELGLATDDLDEYNLAHVQNKAVGEALADDDDRAQLLRQIADLDLRTEPAVELAKLAHGVHTQLAAMLALVPA